MVLGRRPIIIFVAWFGLTPVEREFNFKKNALRGFEEINVLTTMSS
jgi:hypothetical protein